MASVLPYQNGFRAYVAVKGSKRKTKLFHTKAEAMAWASEVEERLKPISTAYQKDKQGKTLKWAFEFYKKHDQKDKRWRTVRRENQVAVHVLKQLGDYALSNITAPRIQEYLDDRAEAFTPRKTLYSASAIRMEKGLISSIFNCAVLRGYAASNPVLTARFRTKKVKIAVSRIREEQQADLFAMAHSLVFKTGQGKRMNASVIPWLEFMFATGMRPGEASRIELAWLNLHISRERQTHRAFQLNRSGCMPAQLNW